MYNPVDVLTIFAVRLLNIYSYIILARVIMSWIIRDPYNRFYIFILKITEPVLSPIRNLLPRMGLDFSPIIVYFIINLIIGILGGSR